MSLEPRPRPVFSPSQTSEWLDDPTGWYLRYIKHVRTKHLKKKDVSAILGTAFADGMAAYNNWVLGRPAENPPSATEREDTIKAAAKVAEQRARDDMAKVIADERSVYEDEAPSWKALPERAATAVIKYILADPTPPSWKLRHAELTLPDHGYCRIDAGYDTPLGPGVADYKTKVTLDARYEQSTLTEYQYAWQMMHYAWAYGEYLGKKVNHFAILLLVLEPKKKDPIWHPVFIEPEHMQIWVASAREVWQLMEEMRVGLRRPWCTFRFHTRFGRTDWADAILNCKLDENLMRQGYVFKKEIAT